ncbi:sorting nexin-13-like isoform X3 [Pieris brassicae]|uniref:sorting nexin-13-like isoform X3 n=1 Tax=Pieris brassicae TaxID=7116 RepID=UPI001E65FDDA|nr:sorting nexin-13-like isoform X3 [Pieris brassicae]
MAYRILAWFSLISVITIALLGFGLYLALLTFLISFIAGVLTILHLNFDSRKIFSSDIDCLDDPLQLTNYSIQSPKILQLFQNNKPWPKFDNRITGSETVDSFLNEIITIIINDYVTPWYEVLTDDQEFTDHAIKQTVVITSANVTNRIKLVDWIYLLSTKFPEELTTHLKLFKQSRVKLKHIQLLSAKEVANGSSKLSPKKQEERKAHRRNKSDTDLSWAPDSHTFGKSKFYGSSENIGSTNLKDIFFDLECAMENKLLCRDTFCLDPEKEYSFLCEVSEAILYLVAPEEAWKCHALKLIIIELLSSIVLKPIFNMLSDPDNINRAIIRTCCRDSLLPSELFLLVIRTCADAEELDATLELVQKDIQKLHSKDSAGEWELQDRQKLSSLQYLARIIQARRATMGPQEGTNNASTEKVSEEVLRSLKFLRATAAWRSNAQYLLEIEMNETDVPHTSKAVIDNLRSSALELCDLYLAPNRQVMGLPENCHSEMVRKITTEGEEFTNNPLSCFDDVQKCVCNALEDDPTWQADFMLDTEQDGADRSTSELRTTKAEGRKYGGASSLSAGASNSLSMSQTEISGRAKNYLSPLSAYIIETALVQDKGRTFGIYAIAVTRSSDNEVWHIYRRYSDFYELHSAVKDKWPELGNLPFPAKKTFQNTSRTVLENRKRMLNSYLQHLTSISRDSRYMALLSPAYLGGFLSSEIQTERHGNTIDALLVNSIKAGMRTLKSMPDQFANTVDGVMDGISKVFQGKSIDNEYDFKRDAASEGQDDGDESVPLKLLEEVLGIRGLWLRRRLLAPVRTLIADRVNKKVLELIAALTSPRNVVQYLKSFKQWLTSRNNSTTSSRDSATKARTRVAAKVALLAAAPDDLKHIVGTDAARRGLLTVFDLFQTQEINKRLLLVLLEVALCNLFPDNNVPEIFKKLYSNSTRISPPKKSVNTNTI